MQGPCWRRVGGQFALALINNRNRSKHNGRLFALCGSATSLAAKFYQRSNGVPLSNTVTAASLLLLNYAS